MRKAGSVLFCILLLMSVLFLVPLFVVAENNDCEEVGHNFTKATCTAAKKCTVCGFEEGEALGHRWQGATCTTPKTCSRCQIKEGERKGHVWEPATCTRCKKCKRCYLTEGWPLGHKVEEYVCGEEPRCVRCNLIVGSYLKHEYDNSWDEDCNRCKYTRIVDYDYVISVGETLVIEEKSELPMQVFSSNSKVLEMKSNLNYDGKSDPSSHSGVWYYHRITLVAHKAGTVRVSTKYQSMSGRDGYWFVKVVENDNASQTTKSTTTSTTKKPTTTKTTEKTTKPTTTESTTQPTTIPVESTTVPTESTTVPITQPTIAPATDVKASSKEEASPMWPYVAGGIGGVLVIAGAIFFVLKKKK